MAQGTIFAPTGSSQRSLPFRREYMAASGAVFGTNQSSIGQSKQPGGKRNCISMIKASIVLISALRNEAGVLRQSMLVRHNHNRWRESCSGSRRRTQPYVYLRPLALESGHVRNATRISMPQSVDIDRDPDTLRARYFVEYLRLHAIHIARW